MTDERPAVPFGAWPSSITLDMVVAGARSVGTVWADGDDLYWLEGRPQEAGRQVIMRRDAGGHITDVTPARRNVRTMVHEYGGGAFVVDDGRVFFSELADGRLNDQPRHGPPEPLTPAGAFRYADIRPDQARGRLLCVREDHTVAETEAMSSICAVDVGDGATTVLIHGADFYSHPRPDPGGQRMAWISWSHPDMPWDSSELWVGRFDEAGAVVDARLIAGGQEESIGQPEWAPDGSLVFVSDRTGWWNLYRWREAADGAGVADSGDIVALCPMEAEFLDPQWVFGQSCYGIDTDGAIVAAARSGGRDRLYRIPAAGPPVELEVPFHEIGSLRVFGASVAFIGSGPTEAPGVVVLDPATGSTQLVYRPDSETLDPVIISTPRAITFPSSDGRKAHALFYPPVNPHVRAPEGKEPPLVVMSHGGPTSNATATLDLERQFFTSRGFAVVDVDYGGSTGYGRAYRRSLDGQWGIVDVEDCTAAALYLADQGQADRSRLVIRGGSAGGYTTLRALTETDAFAAGASHYGVADLEALARETHKFESRYLDRLVGPYPARTDLYRERSPIHATERLSCPLIVLQGLDDKVVPPAQAEELVSALDRKGIPHAYVPFEGEGHGFRRAENIRRALAAELSFYGQLFQLHRADDPEPVTIVHLDEWRARSAQTG